MDICFVLKASHPKSPRVDIDTLLAKLAEDRRRYCTHWAQMMLANPDVVPFRQGALRVVVRVADGNAIPTLVRDNSPMHGLDFKSMSTRPGAPGNDDPERGARVISAARSNPRRANFRPFHFGACLCLG